MSVSPTVLCTYYVPSIKTKTKSMKQFLQNNFKFMLKKHICSLQGHILRENPRKKRSKTDSKSLLQK